ncbi:MAG: MATE family efflux transporter [Spirochaetia bacterium]|nr:MATE family efflux transporter [Spirochaetia bacterium]
MNFSQLKPLMKIALPLMAGNFVQTLYNLTDAYFLGKLGTAELSAPTIAFPVIFFLILFGIGLSMAGTTLIAQSHGKGSRERVDFYLGQATTILLTTAVLIAALGIFLTSPLLMLLQTPENVFDFTRDYMLIVFSGLPFMFGFIVMQSAMQGIGRTVVPLVIQLITVALNIILDPLFIYGLGVFPAWGVQGAAVATVCARAVGSAIAFYILFQGRYGMQLRWAHMRPQAPSVRLFLKIGLPSSFGQAVSALGFTVLQGLVNYFGTAVIAAFGVGNRLIGLFNMPAMGISRATTSLVGQRLGAKDKEGARQVVVLSILVLQVFLLPAMTLAFFYGSSFIRFFVDDPETIRYGAEMFRVVAPSVVLFSFFHATIGAFQGAGDTKPVMYLNIARLWALRLPVAYILAFVIGIGPSSIWWAMFVSNMVTAAVSLYYFKQGRWLTALDPDKV